MGRRSYVESREKGQLSNYYFDTGHESGYAHTNLIVPLATREASMPSRVLCQICQRPVSLEKARINEMGKPVHESCYVQAIRATKSPQPMQQPKPRL